MFCFSCFLLVLPPPLISLVCVFSLAPSCVHSVVLCFLFYFEVLSSLRVSLLVILPCTSCLCDCLPRPNVSHLCLVSFLHLSPVLPLFLSVRMFYLLVYHSLTCCLPLCPPCSRPSPDYSSMVWLFFAPFPFDFLCFVDFGFVF